jgi:RNA polymerase sigma-70 factor (ECF subfamily)
VGARARSRAIDRLRSLRRREDRFRTPLDDESPSATGATSPADRAADRTLVETALARLPDPQRQVIAMAFYEGFTQSEIARRLGEPLGTIKTRMRAGLDRLRGQLGATGAGRP